MDRRSFLAPSPTPYPYLVLDDSIASNTLRDMRRNWPGIGSFAPEIPGNFVCNVAQFIYDNKGFWGEFTIQVVPKLVISLLSMFAGYLEKRFPGERSYYLSNYSVMQSLGSYGGHDVHTHHYHDPQWVMTILVYLDHETNGHHGTTILRVKDGLDEAHTAAQTLNWHDMTEEVETLDYKQGRILVFYENPVSFHSVKPSMAGARFGRRILRFHVSANNKYVEKLYGCDLATYQQKRQNPSNDPQVLQWMRNDIETMRNPVVMSEEEKIKWGSEIRLGIPRPVPVEGIEEALP